ncbi:MAG: hypothetical protein KGJ02_04610 [Verrucomicrobiota bacterium]|nr:hypothetical protein [Verrucomicrobiota bacterium]
MKKHHSQQLPIRLKIEMVQEVAEIIHCFQNGQRAAVDLLIEDLKSRCVHLDEKIQQDVLMFAEQVQFQFTYDQWHTITQEIQSAADHLIEDLGLQP